MEHQNPQVTAAGHQTIMPYIVVENAAGFIEFAKTVFEMELQHRKYRSEGVIAHAELRHEGCTIMVADTHPGLGPKPAGLFIYVFDADETYQLALDHGATSVSPPSDQPYGREAGINDAWGNTWWITSFPDED